ncbi:MAG: cellobiose phosphorylase, partial [Oscillospiraceae bacterium]|nr:cellobiose phosphorylase [Oscillospiraceae bacterium]
IKKSGNVYHYEPFQSRPNDNNIIQKMRITSHDLCIEDGNRELGIKTEVMYSTLPGENLAALVRELTITNLSDQKIELEVVDGLPVIIPFYLADSDIKTFSNLRQAWMGVQYYEKIPFYKILVNPDDTAETSFITGGSFYMSFHFDHNKPVLSSTIIEPTLLFGCMTDFSYPEKFNESDFAIPDKQVDAGLTPCGFGYHKCSIKPGSSEKLYSLTGYSDSYEKVEDFYSDVLSEKYIEDKIDENKLLIQQIKQYAFTLSSRELFDMYCGQTMLDNILRGGYPVNIGGHSYYVYSRKHGDLEREYNFFQVDSTYYSQGNANFRDVNQNRRNDVNFFPFIGDSNIRSFFNLLQLDGFNPLVVKGSAFSVSDQKALDILLEEYVLTDFREIMKAFFKLPFIPGGLMMFMEEQGIKQLKGKAEEFLEKVMSISIKIDEAEFKEGYWVDHWTYNTDLLTQFLSVFPDKIEEILFDDKEYTYYDSDEFVLPRSQKYVLTERGVRQYGATKKDKEKTMLIESRKELKTLVRDDFGKGKIYKTTLIAKIFTLLVNKIASLDAEGTGVEMEAGKPGWCDALNGLPGIFGSSINESAEISRLARLMLDLTSSIKDREIALHEEIFDFYTEIKTLMDLSVDGFEYWDKSTLAKEKYREKIFYGVSGNERLLSLSEMRSFFKMIMVKVESGLNKAYDEQSGVYSTYFINEVSEYKVLNKVNQKRLPLVRALEFKQRPIARFLEGPVHVIRAYPEKAKGQYEAVKKTGLYDEKLDMYKVNENIMNETKEIGRQNIFPRGWLENEAIFLHMEYKYFLELLRAGLYDEFFHYFKHSLIPFLDPSVYGRSTLENCTFIVSTVHPDPKIHGSGYVSRLTGASAEFLSMWLFITVGQKPFTLDADKNLTLEFKPVLPSWLFTEKSKKINITGFTEIELPANVFAFNFLGQILTVYHNISHKDTFGPNAARITAIRLTDLDGKVVVLDKGFIGLPYAEDIRSGKYMRIDIYLE